MLQDSYALCPIRRVASRMKSGSCNASGKFILVKYGNNPLKIIYFIFEKKHLLKHEPFSGLF